MNPEQHPTSNIQRPTSNGSSNPRSLRRSMFDVGCSMFFLRFRGFNARIFISGKYFPTGDNSGLQVPLVVYIPDKFKDLRPPEYKPGGKSDRPVSFVDFAPTVLSLAGIQPDAGPRVPRQIPGGAAVVRPRFPRSHGRTRRPRAQRHRRPLRSDFVIFNSMK